MVKQLVRSRAGLSSAGCPGCSPALAGTSSARTFSTRTTTPTTTRLASSPRHTSLSASPTPLTQLTHPQTRPQPLSRSFASSPARLGSEAAQAENEAKMLEWLAQQELDEIGQMMQQFEEQLLARKDVPAPATSYATPTRSPSHSTSSPGANHSDPTPTAEPVPAFNSFNLLRPSFPAGPPTISDLNSLRPKQFSRPDASSPESLRILYTKSWTAGLNNLNSAFKKSQLIKMATLPTEQGGLELKHDDPRLKVGIKLNKRAKYWKPKKFEMMSKRELSQAIMVLEWGLVEPETLPKAKIGPSVVETMPLSDRSLFLLLSPNSTTLLNLSRSFGVKASFTRDPETGALMLSLSGTKASVQQAKEEITSLPEVCPQQEFELPRPATTLRPEMFQAVSRLSKTFLEPGSESNTLAATAIDKHSIDRAERLLNTAFTSDALRTSHRTFASLPTSLDSLEYSLFPFAPANPAPWTAGATGTFARVQAMSLAPLANDPQMSEEQAKHAAALDFEVWAAKLRLDKTARVPLSQEGPKSALPALMEPFVREVKKGERLEMKATFGHLAWPVYPPTAQPTADQEGPPLGLGPVLEGSWTFAKFAKWRNEIGDGTKSVFLGCPPPGHLASTAILTPTQSANPFSAILSELDVAEMEQDLNTLPTIESEEFRQLVYRPLALPAVGEANERIEVEYETGAGVVRRSKIKENKVVIMVPNGAIDFQVALSRTTEVAPSAVPELPSASSPAPLLVHLDSIPYILATDRNVRRTFVIPPATPAKPLAKDEEPPLPRVQERWTDNLREEGGGAEVSVLLGEGKGENFWAARWRGGLKECETVAMRGKRGGELAKLFGGPRRMR